MAKPYKCLVHVCLLRQIIREQEVIVRIRYLTRLVNYRLNISLVLNMVIAEVISIFMFMSSRAYRSVCPCVCHSRLTPTYL